MASPHQQALDGQTKVPEIISIITVCCVLTSTLVLLRVVTRAWIVRAFGPDDWVLVVAQVLSVAAATAIGLGETRRPGLRGTHTLTFWPQNSTLAWAATSGPLPT